MSTLLAKIQIFPGKETVFEEVMAVMYKQTHDNESGVLRYEYWRGREQGFYYCLLSFESSVAFWRHQASDHHEGEMERFAQCIAELDLELLDPVDHASPLPLTRPRPCPEDETEAVREQAVNFPLELSDWWRALRVQ